jgi:single-stranded-DNA-specific exonuclease
MAQPAKAFLGVSLSVLGRRWVERNTDARLALGLAQRLGIPEAAARVMAGRGVSLDQADAYLQPSLRALLPDPSRLKDMDRAVERLAQAIETREPIAILADYDVDGATSAALLHRFLSAVGAPPRIYVPDRAREGYGPNRPALERLAAEGAGVVLTLDCGTTAFEVLDKLDGLDVIVVDHHVAEARLPNAFAVINPNRLDEAKGLGELAAVGVTFLLVVALNRALRNHGHFVKGRVEEPDLLRWLDLVALGTVADVVPLTGLNRAFVAQGLKVLAQGRNAGLKALADCAGIEGAWRAYHLGYVLGPRVNAGGRVGTPDLGARLLACDDSGEATAMALRLQDYNAERQRIEAQVLAAAMAEVEREGGAAGGVMLAAGKDWHIGVIGIVAGRMKEKFDRPAIVIAIDGSIGKGSARSVPGIDIGAAIIAARQAGLLVDGGGHPMAGGFTVVADKIPALRHFLSERIGLEAIRVNGGPRLALDAAVAVAGASLDLAVAVDRMGPFGAGNPEPRFALPNVRISGARVVGSSHVSCFIADANGGGRLRGIAFRALGTPLGDALLGGSGMPQHLAGELRRDSWNGEERVQFLIEDLAEIGSATAQTA